LDSDSKVQLQSCVELPNTEFKRQGSAEASYWPSCTYIHESKIVFTLFTQFP